MFPKTLQSFYENRKNIPIRAIFTKKYRMFPENRFKKVPVKRFCAKNQKESVVRLRNHNGAVEHQSCSAYR